MSSYETKMCAEQSYPVNHLGGHYQEPTLSENIDNQITQLTIRIKELEDLKEELNKPNGLLNVPLNVLRGAMNF